MKNKDKVCEVKGLFPGGIKEGENWVLGIVGCCVDLV